jgi:hypothetical protein
MVALILYYPMSPATDCLKSQNGHKRTHSEMISCKEKQCGENILVRETATVYQGRLGGIGEVSIDENTTSIRPIPILLQRRFVPNPSSKT